MIDTHDADWEIGTLSRILEHTCQKGILLHLQSSETAELPERNDHKLTSRANTHHGHYRLVKVRELIKSISSIPWTYMGTQLGNSLPEKFQETAASLPTFCQQMKQLELQVLQPQEPGNNNSRRNLLMTQHILIIRV